MSEYVWLNEASQVFLERDYLLPGQTVDERVDVIVNHAESILGIAGFGAKFKSYLQKGWYSLSTPVWTNFGTDRGLPISCFGTHIDDTMESIVDGWAEVAMMTKHGGGTSGFFGNLRGRGSAITNNGQSHGAVHFMQPYDQLITIISQGNTRRGNFAGWLPIDHPDIQEFLRIKTEGHPIQVMSYGVTVSDAWMQAMIDGDEDKQNTWARVLTVRQEVGFPYIMFTDTANRNKPDVYKDKGLEIRHSNLCTEIMLPNDGEESFVCDLSSMNIAYYEDWKDTDAVETMVYFLDAVMTDFINRAKQIPHFERPVRFAERHRALGLGWLGWHTYLQRKMIPFESTEAKFHNAAIARRIYEQAYAASAKLAQEYGEPELLKGYGRRNTTLLAIAPTKSSAFILGQVSEGIEPHESNYFIKDLQKIKAVIKNQELEALLESKGKNTEAVWDSILDNAGSVQHLNFLDEREKAVFKTFAEISMMEVVIQAAQRQKWLDQGQSLNMMIDPEAPVRDVNALLIEGWKLGVKSFYYHKGQNAAQTFAQDILRCVSCEA